MHPNCIGMVWVRGRTDALHEGWVQAVSEQGLWQLTEVQLQRPRDGIDVHVTQHHQDVFAIFEGEINR